MRLYRRDIKEVGYKGMKSFSLFQGCGT